MAASAAVGGAEGRRLPQIAPMGTDFRQVGNLSRSLGDTEGRAGTQISKLRPSPKS